MGDELTENGYSVTGVIISTMVLSVFLIYCFIATSVFWKLRLKEGIKQRRPLAVVLSAIGLAGTAVSRNLIEILPNQVNCAADVLTPISFFFLASTMWLLRVYMLRYDFLKIESACNFIEARDIGLKEIELKKEYRKSEPFSAKTSTKPLLKKTESAGEPRTKRLREFDNSEGKKALLDTYSSSDSESKSLNSSFKASGISSPSFAGMGGSIHEKQQEKRDEMNEIQRKPSLNSSFKGSGISPPSMTDLEGSVQENQQDKRNEWNEIQGKSLLDHLRQVPEETKQSIMRRNSTAFVVSKLVMHSDKSMKMLLDVKQFSDSRIAAYAFAGYLCHMLPQFIQLFLQPQLMQHNVLRNSPECQPVRKFSSYITLFFITLDLTAALVTLWDIRHKQESWGMKREFLVIFGIAVSTFIPFAFNTLSNRAVEFAINAGTHVPIYFLFGLTLPVSILLYSSIYAVLGDVFLKHLKKKNQLKRSSKAEDELNSKAATELLSVLNDQEKCMIFQEYLNTEFNTVYLLFFKDVERFRADAEIDAATLFETYILPDAPLYIQLPTETRKKLLDAITDDLEDVVEKYDTDIGLRKFSKGLILMDHGTSLRELDKEQFDDAYRYAFSKLCSSFLRYRKTFQHRTSQPVLTSTLSSQLEDTREIARSILCMLSATDHRGTSFTDAQ